MERDPGEAAQLCAEPGFASGHAHQLSVSFGPPSLLYDLEA